MFFFMLKTYILKLKITFIDTRYTKSLLYIKIQDKGQMIHKKFESNMFLNKDSLNIVCEECECDTQGKV